MTKGIFNEKHYASNIHEDMQAICEPVLAQHNIKHFSYGRFFDDGTFYMLMTHRGCYKLVLEKEHPLFPIIPNSMLKPRFNYICMPSLDDSFSPVLKDIIDIANVSHYMILFERHDHYFDFYAYAAANGSAKDVNAYLSNLSHFENFKLHFTRKADHLISAAAKDKNILPYHMRPNFGGLKQHDNVPKHYYLGGEFNDIYLTRQEVHALKYLAHGETMKEAGGLAGLSPRTIESYLNNVRMKMGLNKRHEIIKVVSKYIAL